MASRFADSWLSRFGDNAALVRRMEWDGLSVKDFDELPARLLRATSVTAHRAEAALRRRDAHAAEAVLSALDRGESPDESLERLIALPSGLAALSDLVKSATESAPAGPVQSLLRRISLAHDIAALDEVQRRLRRDAGALDEHFGFRADALRKAEAMGDPHAGGRRVVRLEDAAGRAVFLKPRPLDGERLLARLSRQLGPAGRGIVLPPMLARPRHGWVAEALPGGATALRAVGALIAIADLSAAVDLHAENLLPVPGGVAVIDGEMALHPDLPCALMPPEARSAAAALRSSVLRTGLLPEPGQPRALCGLAAWGAAGRMSRSDAGQVAEGYGAALGRIAAVGGARAALDAALPRRGTVRLLLRHSAGYARLLERLRDPRATPDGAALALHLELLCIGMARHQRRRPALWGVAAAEVSALLRGDIPRFWMNWDETSIQEGDGRALPCAAIARTPRVAALTRAARLGPARMAAQLRMMRRVLSAA